MCSPLHTLLGDLSYGPPDVPRSWLPNDILAAILPFTLPTLPPNPPDRHPSPCVGQFWVRKGTATTWEGASTNSCRSVKVTNQDTPSNAGPRPAAALACFLSPEWVNACAPSAPLAELAFFRIIVHSSGTATVLAAFQDRFLPPRSSTPWTDIFREHLDPQRRWRIYADGSWRAAFSLSPHDFFLDPGGTHGGGAALLSPKTPKTGPRPPSMSSPSRFRAWRRSTEAFR